MVINHETLQSLFRTLSMRFEEGVQRKPAQDLSFMSFDVNSSSEANEYPWVDDLGKWREWLGDRVYANIKAHLHRVPNRDFEKSHQIHKNKLADDTYGMYGDLVAMTGAGWPQLLNDIRVEVITGNTVCFTGKALFANDHAYGGNTIDNLVTDALSATSFEAAFTAAAAWKFANDDLIKPLWTHLVHGPKLRSTAFNIVDAEKIVSGGAAIDNPNYKRCIRAELPDLAGTYDDYWMLVDASGMIRPVCTQIRETPSPLMDTDPVRVKTTGYVDFLADGRAAASPTFPHLVYGGRL